MARRKSRDQRKKSFMAVAERMYERLEDWYDAHPEASFGEIEQKARQVRREMMGAGLEVVINGRDAGYRVEGVACEGCGGEMTFQGYLPWTVFGLEGDTRLERAYYVCPECEGETFFPPG
jgi:hypothetical protein